MTTPTKVWIVTAEHDTVPGRLVSVYSSKEHADEQAALLKSRYRTELEYCEVDEHSVQPPVNTEHEVGMWLNAAALSIVSNALRVAAERFDDNADVAGRDPILDASVGDRGNSLAAQFKKQATDCRSLYDAIATHTDIVT